MATSPGRTELSDILDPLTPAQQAAVRHVDGPLLILAGPGSGKTRVVTHRIAYMLAQGIAARNILALTFTNKAAEEMQLRLARMAPGRPVWIGTFHRFCARLLRIHASLVGLSENFSIYDSDDSRRLLKAVIRESHLELSHVTPEQIGSEISNAKNALISSEMYRPMPGNSLGAIVGAVYPAYQSRLLTANAVDFDDLLLHVALLLQDNPELRSEMDSRYRYVSVDEYQDTNFAQYAIVRGLSQDHSNLAATGDPDQSIYGWRGANLNNILDFEKDFPEVQIVRLEQNYRSTANILRVADQLIQFNVRRKQKALFTDNPSGVPVRLVTYPTCRDEADHISSFIADEIARGERRPKDFAIFYRVNSLSRRFESSLRNLGVPYQIIRGLEFYQRKEIKDVLAYLQLINNPANDVALLRIINTPPRKIGKTTVGRIAEHARRYKLSLLEAAREAGLIESLGKRAAVQVAAFVAMQDRLNLAAAAPLEEIVGRVLKETGYEEWLEASSQEEDADRLENLHELLNDAREFDARQESDAPLESFLEEVSLASDIDDWENESDRVSLMTLHAAKGLEFPVVFIVAAEQNFMPHLRSQDDPESVEEERRLLFVGITRAEQELQLSLAAYRFVQGSQRMSMPSPFLIELPREEMEVHEPPGRSAHPSWNDPLTADDDSTEWDQTPAADEVWNQDVETVLPPQESSVDGSSLRMVTAAELLSDDIPQPALDPEAFHLNMVVQHPEFGLGKVVALSGEGDKRAATVSFFSRTREKRFVLRFSELRPVKSSA